jgi:hypothetical protein
MLLQGQSLENETFIVLLTDKVEVAWSIGDYLDDIRLFFDGETRQVFEDEVERLLEVADMVVFVGKEGLDGVL